MPKTHAHDLGLGHDLHTLRKRELSRRSVLRWSALSGLGLVTYAFAFVGRLSGRFGRGR